MDAALIEATLNRMTRVFHKEDDFQQALCWKLHQHFPSLTIRAEYPVKGINVDLWLIDGNTSMALELKYPKKPFHADTDHETFRFGNDPTDIACFDYLADIERIEGLVESEVCDHGAALILSNDSRLWDNSPSGKNYNEFLLSDGRTLPEEMRWAEGASISKKRDRPIKLRGEYTISWSDYSYQYPEGPTENTTFQYCISEIC